MLELIIKENEFFQQSTNKFIQIPECMITLEHSLISLSKWESKWQIPYFTETPKTQIQEFDYIRCMVVGKIKNDRVFDGLTHEDIITIQNYISAPMTATTFSEKSKPKATKKEVTTAESIYARMFAHRIPLECQQWHLNRLLTLLKVCDLQNAPKDKMTKKQTSAWNAEQNAARRAKYNSRG